jgi:hypothetical protein
MTPEQRTIRLQVMVTSDELQAIEDRRFAIRLPPRAAAFRELMRQVISASNGEEHGSMNYVKVGQR